MKSILIGGLAMLLAGCAVQSTTAPVAAEMVPVLGPRAFVCTDGQMVTLDHDRPAGVMRASRGGENFVLQEQVGVSPPRFVTGADTLIFAENEIFLQRGKAVRQTCTRLPPAPEPGAIWGTLAKMDRMALVPGSRAKVLLVDAARADAPAIEIASTRITTGGNQVPLHFLIRYPADRVVPRPMTYRLEARIERPDGALQFITDTAVFVLESDAPPPPVALMLVRTGASG